MDALKNYYNLFSTYQKLQNYDNEPKQLYEPISYILSLGGKKIRPLLTLMAAEAFGGKVDDALPAALAIELFHNFSLIHDDIMDGAPLRRGQPTVHHKWDVNTGILSGDAMLIRAYQCFESYDPIVFKQLMTLFSQTAIQVCEGQQWDVDFENISNVEMAQYLKMIEYKTSVLLAAALQMGAIVSGANEVEQQQIYNYGLNLGLAFQLLDDYLDAFGDPETFGKQVGGDIIENKKTYLYIKALELANEEEKKSLLDLFQTTNVDIYLKIEQVKAIFLATGAAIAIKEKISNYTEQAFKQLDGLNLSMESKQIFIAFGQYLMEREV
jgi:geranylgeranyl diphosphate synthase type II